MNQIEQFTKSETTQSNAIQKTMKTNRTKNLLKALSLGALLTVGTIASHAQDIPAAINYQGRLTDNLGNTLDSGYYEIEFRVWDDPTSTSAASLIWGRTFPLHVVDGGLFNILLSNDGGEITSPGTPQFNDIRQAFSGEDRYLGLTIAVDPSGTITSPVEISPRQQLASAPYAIQAQTANSVRNLGVTSEALANGAISSEKIAASGVATGNIADGAVTTVKIASGAVTTDKISNSQVTAAKIGNGQVTSEKLNINGDFHLNDHAIFLRGGTDENHGLKHALTFSGSSVDGPALFGFEGGALGTTQGGDKAALEWRNDQSVTMLGEVSMRSGAVSAFGPLQDLSVSVRTVNLNHQYQVDTDGVVLMFSRRGSGWFQLWQASAPNTPVFNFVDGKGWPFWNDTNNADGGFLSFPVRKGDKFRWIIAGIEATAGSEPNFMFFRPYGNGTATRSN